MDPLRAILAMRWSYVASLALASFIFLAFASTTLLSLHDEAPQRRTAALSLQINHMRQASAVHNSTTHGDDFRESTQQNVQSLAPATAPPATTTPSVINGRRTMVFIVNFLDSKRCAETLDSMFSNALHPELLRVSIHDQIYESIGDLRCVDAYCQLVGKDHCHRKQIVTTSVDAKEAAGPTVARAETEKALGDEDFCLGLDSHMVFIPQWDEKLVGNWEATENPNAILTIYPKSTEYLTDHSMDDKMGLQCRGNIEGPDDDAIIQYQAVRWLDKTNTTKPRLQSQFAGGFNFGPCQSYRDVPNDPYTPILFYGEEYARAARLWTWGYDMYAPSVDVVFHYFEARKRIWDSDWPRKFPMMQRSKRRVRFMMGLPVSSDDFDRTDLDKYGLGTKRTFAQWREFSGIDPTAKFTKDPNQFNNCRELELVPFNH